MKAHRAVESFDIEIPREEAYRLLGMHLKKREPIESVMNSFDHEYDLARDLIDARAVSLLSDTGLPGSSQFDAAAPIALVVCTIGGALEERVTRLSAEGSVTRAMLLDAIGSAAAEAVADLSNGRICAEALQSGFDPGPRVSPGYGTWALEEQAWLFQALAPGEIGVSLSEHYMMTPRKSISYAVPLLGGAVEPGGRCAHCGLEDCAFRAVDLNHG